MKEFNGTSMVEASCVLYTGRLAQELSSVTVIPRTRAPKQ